MKTRFLITAFTLAALLAACSAKTYGSQSYSPGQAAVPTNNSAPTSAPTSAPVSTGSDVKIDISGFAFNPGTVTIKVGQTITWTNQDGASHTVVADDGSFTSGNLAQGASFSHAFETAGTYTYKCGIHLSMLGTVVVQP